MSHLGITLSRHCAGEFQVFEVLYRAGTHLREHVHDRPGLTTVFQGELGERASSSTDVSPGKAILRPAGCRHANRFDSADTRCLVIELPQSRWPSFGPLLPRPDEPFMVERPELDRLQRRVVAKLHDVAASNDYYLEAAVLELLGSVAAALCAGREATWAVRAAAHLDRDPLASADEVAAAVGAPSGELDRVFRASQGISLLGYRVARRLERARELLLNTSRPLSDIAAETGFYDQAHLTNAFRQSYGTSPGRYRRSASRDR